jgi:hypothetical protein
MKGVQMFLRVTDEDRIFLLQLANSLREYDRIPNPDTEAIGEAKTVIVLTAAAADLIAKRIDDINSVDRNSRPPRFKKLEEPVANPTEV